MKLTLDKPAYFRDALNIIGELVQEAKFDITSDGIKMACMDTANVAFIGFHLLKDAFSLYQLEKDIKIVISIDKLKNILNKASDKDILNIEMKDTRLLITLKGRTTKKFLMPTLDVEIEEKAEPTHFKFDATIYTKSAYLNDAIDVASMLEGSVVITVLKNEISFKTNTQSTKYSTYLSNDTKIIINTAKVQSKFATDYLVKFCKASKLSENVILHLKDEFPIKIEYKIPDKMIIYFVLAPRVDDK